MHFIGLFNLIITVGIFITAGIDAFFGRRREEGVQNPWINHAQDVIRHDNNKGIHDPILRIRRNKEKIPLMLGKGSSIVTNSTNVSGFLSDLKIECRTTDDCNAYLQSACSDDMQVCNCTRMYPVFVPSQKTCIKPAALNASCSFLEQCVYTDNYSVCDTSKKTCVCIENYFLKEFPIMGYRCVTKSSTDGMKKIDPTMITVLVALGLMFVIICVVLRLFSKARFRENRSIFNTPNPRLMNASLFKDSKLLSPARGARRGSSVRGPSRTASICSVNKDTPRRSANGSLSKERRGSALSTVSATGSAAGGTPHSRAISAATGENHQSPQQTTVAIEAVD